MTRSGKPSGNPNGRPATSTEGKTTIDMLMKNVPVDIVEILDGLRKGTAFTRKDVLIRVVREYELMRIVREYEKGEIR